ncbi:MAG: hypothetical protein WED00_17505 [Aquisalimonadaceae bacterium]
MGLEQEDPHLYEDDDIEDLGDLIDDEPVPTRRSGVKAGGRNYRRSIEELHEERRLRRMLSELDQEFPDL